MQLSNSLIRLCATAGLFALFAALSGRSAELRHGSIVTEHLMSTVLRDTRTGVDPNRTIMVYLPPGYADSGQSYPVVYYCHNIFWSPAQMFADGNLVNLLERGFANGIVGEFILVAADYSVPGGAGSLYENSPVSGRWLDFTAEELVPFIDGRFRTLRQRESRGLAGDFMGGRGALKLAMEHAEIFGSVYALHPVATGMGYIPWKFVGADWRKILAAKSFSDLEGDRLSQVFLAICQAFLPNAGRPPFFCDFVFELQNGEPTFSVENAQKTKRAFSLDQALDESAAKLRTMRGIAFDWSRYDPNQDHVYGAAAFSRRLEDLGVEHEAEEYRGIWWRDSWTAHGRFYARVLPFFAEHLVFGP